MWKRDYYGLMTFVETAHAYLLLGEVDKAFNAIKSVYASLQALETQIKQQTRRLDLSPLAPTYYYLAEIYMIKAKALQKQPDKAAKMQKLMGQALNLYNKVNNTYSGSPQALPALKKFQQARVLYEKLFDKTIRMKKDPKKGMDLAGQLYRENKFDEAARQYLKVALMDVKGPYTAEALFYSTACLYKAGRFLEAMAVVDFMADIRPKHERTHNMVYSTAVNIWTAREKQSSKAMTQIFVDDAIYLFARLVKLNPLHPNAPYAAFRVAEAQWAKAGRLNLIKRDLAEKVAREPDPAKKRELQKQLDEAIERMKQAYKDAIPFYQVLAEHYGQSTVGIRAYHKLGWIYYIVGDDENTAKSFLEYCQIESELKAEKVEAKFIAAERLYRAEEFEEALKHFNELLEWIKPNGEYSAWLEKAKKAAAEERDRKRRLKGLARGAKKTKTLGQKTLALIPWCYDKQANVLFAKAEVLEEKAKEFDARVAQIKTILEKQTEKKKPEEKAEPGKTPEPPPAKPAPGKGEKKSDKAKAEKKKPEPAAKPGPGPPAGQPTFTKGKLPEDFRFHYLTKVKRQADLIKDLDEKNSFVIVNENELWLTQDDDLVISLGGRGLKITQEAERRFLWATEYLACYRGGWLIGIYDFRRKAFRAGKKGQAPEAVALPKPAKMAKLEGAFRIARLLTWADAKRLAAEKLREAALKLQDKALAGLEKFLSKHSDDDACAPPTMLRQGMIYITRNKFDKAAEVLGELLRRYPNVPDAQKAVFQLFRAYLKTGQPEKAAKHAEGLLDKITELALGNLIYVANELFSEDNQGNFKCWHTKLAVTANQELIRRGTDRNHRDYPRAMGRTGRAIFNLARGLFLQERHDLCLGKCEKLLKQKKGEKENPYYYDLWMLKGLAYRKQGRISDSVRCFDMVLTDIHKQKFKVVYHRAVVESAFSMLEYKEKARVGKAVLRFRQIVEFADQKDPELRLFIEKAHLGLAHSFALLGDRQKALKYQAAYLRKYPRGVFRKEISQLPSARKLKRKSKKEKVEGSE